MPIRIGNTEINKIPVGNNLVSKVYIGEQRILPDTPIDTYVDNIVSLGGDEEIVRKGYTNVPYPIKDKASVIFFPSHVDMYRAYAMDNNTGEALSVYYKRGSVGTYFDSDLNLQIASDNSPRIDYANYSKNVKILVEKETTNLLTDSDFKLNINVIGSGYTIEDFNGLGYFTKKLNLPNNSYYYKAATNNITDSYVLSSFVIKDRIPIINTGSSGGDINGTFVISTNTVATDGDFEYIKDNYWRGKSIKRVPIISGTRGNGIVHYAGQSLDNLEAVGYQLELDEMTSYIPTANSTVTRLADILKINLLKDTQVYIKTTKEEKYLDKPAGVWNVQDDITESDGLLCLAVMENGAFDTGFFDSQFVKGHPKMTSNNAPSPYVTYSNSVLSASYPAWNAFNERDITTSGWYTANGQFNSDGTATGTMPYLWLNLGNTTNAKKFCKMQIRVRNSNDSRTYPRSLTIGYSPDNSSYIYQRFYDLTIDKWETNNYAITLFFEPPVTPMQYWSLTIREDNGYERSGLTDVQLFEDINN